MTLPTSPSHPGPHRLRAAIYDNQRAWVRRAGTIDVAGRHRPAFERAGLLAVRTGTTGAIVLPDPPDTARRALPRALDWLRHEGSGDVLVWAAAPHLEADRWLSAHGAHESFTPRWMSRSLAIPVPLTAAGPATVRRARPEDLSMLLGGTELPYFSPWQARATLRLATATAPDDIALVLALAGNRLVGRGVLSRAASTAGIYDVGVEPAWQRRGIGRQMLHALVEIAREWRVEHVTLNATPAGAALYEGMRFEDAGEGQTWLVPAATVRHPPGEATVRFALAISGGGELSATPALVRRDLPNGDTPLAHAARFDRPDSARRLLDLGTIPDLAALWRLGLETEARALMTDREARDARRGAQRTTPLHVAIYWDDMDFLEALLEAGADPRVRDGAFDSDAWGWCHALGNDAALAILRERFPDKDR